MNPDEEQTVHDSHVHGGPAPFTPFLPPTGVSCFGRLQTAVCPGTEGLPEKGQSRFLEGSSERHRSHNPDQELYWCTGTPEHNTEKFIDKGSILNQTNNLLLSDNTGY